MKHIYLKYACLIFCGCLCLGGIYSCSSSKKVTESKTVAVYDYNDEVFEIVDEMPEYRGGEDGLDQEIQRQLKYPKEAYKQGVSGRVICSIVVRRDGTIQDPKVTRRANFLLEQEALRVLSALPPFKRPAMKDGKPVSVKRTVIVRFVLPGNPIV